MSLRATAERLAVEPTGVIRCPLALLTPTLEPDDADYLEELLSSDKTHLFIQAVLSADGHDIGANAIGRHRLGRCRCDAR